MRRTAHCWLVAIAAVVFLPATAAWAQQPSQRILPRAAAPPSQPTQRSPCTWSFDEGLAMYVRHCSHGGEPALTADRYDRLLVSVTRGPGTLLYWDLDAMGKERFSHYLRTSAVQPADVEEGDFEDSVQLRQMYMGTGEAALGASEPEDKDADTPAPPEKRELVPLPTADVIWRSSEQPLPISTPWTHRFSARADQVITVVVDSVRPAPGYLFPDPVVWLIRLDQGPDPERGRVVSIADDSPDGLPALEYTVLEDGLFRIVVSPYVAENAGRADVTAELDGHPLATVRDMFFGGWVLSLEDMAAGDLLFAGAGESERADLDHDAVLLLLPPPWDAVGKSYQASNNELGTLPLLVLDGSLPEAAVIVAAFHPQSAPDVRLLLSRVGPQRDDAKDADNDRLSADLEDRLGTCDSPAQAVDGLCVAPRPQPAGWTAADTDNDGMSDFAEVYGVRRCFDQVGAPPFYSVPACLKDEQDQCRLFCPDDTAMIAELPLSALDGPDPTVYDLYVEYDYWQLDGEAPGLHRMSDDQVELVERAFESSYRHGDEAANCEDGFCPTPYAVRFHLFQDDAIEMPSLDSTAHMPSLANRSLFFNLHFSPDRKYTGTFQYVLGVHKGGGQGDVGGRAAVFGASGGHGMSLKFMHETGHLLGLRHNVKTGAPNYTPFYLSLMSYAYSHTLPPPIEWDGTFRSCGNTNTCPDLFKCVHFPGHGRLCAPDCGITDSPGGRKTHFGRFSSNQLILPVDEEHQFSETGRLPETGYPEWFLPYLYCFNTKRALSYADRFRRFADSACDGGHCVQCDSGECRIDWDHDGSFEGADGFDVDGDGKLSARPLGDGDDLSRILSLGKKGLRLMAKRTLAAFYTGFQGYGGANVLPYPAVVHEGHGGYTNDVTNFCDEAARWPHCREQNRDVAALFRGPASGDGAIEVRLPDEFCISLKHGVTFSLRVKPLRIPPKEHPAVLLASPFLKLTLYGEAGEATWTAEALNKDGNWRKMQLEDRQALGSWTRLTVVVKNSSESGTFTAKRGTIILSDQADSVSVHGSLCSFSLGAMSAAAASFTGFLDDPLLISGPGRGL